MKNYQIANLANEKGYRADHEDGGIVIWLLTRKPSVMEIERALDLTDDGLVHSHPQGVIIFGIDS